MNQGLLLRRKLCQYLPPPGFVRLQDALLADFTQQPGQFGTEVQCLGCVGKHRDDVYAFFGEVVHFLALAVS